MEIHDELKRFRLLAGLTQQQVAEHFGINTSTYAHYESGRRVPTAKRWVALMKLFNQPTLPARTVATYPNAMLEDFERAITENEQPSSTGNTTTDYHFNNAKIEILQSKIFMILEERSKAFKTDDLPLDEMVEQGYTGTVIDCQLDVRGEYLIERAMKAVNNLMVANGQPRS